MGGDRRLMPTLAQIWRQIFSLERRRYSILIFYGEGRRLTCLFVAQVARGGLLWAAPKNCANPNEEDHLIASQPHSALI
jgi:hypothetical protein